VALNSTNFVALGPIKSADMKQFVDLFTGVMTDQPVTFKNAVVVGGSQGSATAPLKLYGAIGQSSHLLDLYTDTVQLQPGWGIGATGAMAWGPGGTGVQDTFLSRVGTQNGHVSDTAGLFIDPLLEVNGVVNADSFAFSNGTTMATDGAFSVVINQDLTLNRRLNLPYVGNIHTNPSIQLAHAGFISSKDAAGNVIPVFVTTSDDWNSFYCGPAGATFTNSTSTVRVASINNVGDAGFRYVSVGDGTNGVVSTRNGSLYIRTAGGGNSVIMDVGSGGLLVASGPVQSSTFISAGPALSGTPGDLNANRGNNTGYVFLGTNTHYIGFDGTNYVLPTSGLVLAGGLTVAGRTIINNTLELPNNIGSLAMRDASGVPRATLWIDTGNATVITAAGSNVIRFVNSSNSIQYAHWDGSGNFWQDTGNIYATGAVVFPNAANAALKPSTRSGHPSAEVEIDSYVYAPGDFYAGLRMYAISFNQTSNPDLKSNMTVISDNDCMLRIRAAVPVQTYQMAMPPDEEAPQPTLWEIGFSAPDVFAASPEFVTLDASSRPVGVNYANMAAMLWGALRNLDARCQAFGI
jgi:hypothetical protein